jgi:hypothetical protein
VDLAAGRLERRRHADDGRREQCQPDDVDHCTGLKLQREPEGPAADQGEHRALDLTEPDGGEPDTDRRRHAGQHQRFDEQLRHNPAPAGAERPSHRDLALPRRRPRVDEDGDVDADEDQQ